MVQPQILPPSLSSILLGKGRRQVERGSNPLFQNLQLCLSDGLQRLGREIHPGQRVIKWAFILLRLLLPPPNKGQYNFFQAMLSTLVPLMEGTPILGGDSNIALDRGLDKSNPSKPTLTRPTRASLKFARLIHAHGLADVWRESNPKKKDFTHFFSPHKSYGRIDHILLPSLNLPTITSSKIIDTTLSDHSILTVTLHNVSHRPKHFQLRIDSFSLHRTPLEWPRLTKQ